MPGGLALAVADGGDGRDAEREPGAGSLHAVPDDRFDGSVPPRYRVVVADDSEAVRVLVRVLLSLERDFALVGEAATGVEALALIDREQVDVLLVDLSMPELDGLETIERLHETRPDLRIVVYSGHISPQIEAAARRLGAHDFIVKGTPPEELVARVRRAVADA